MLLPDGTTSDWFGTWTAVKRHTLDLPSSLSPLLSSWH